MAKPSYKKKLLQSKFKAAKLPRPETDAEFEVVSYVWFGKVLHFKHLSLQSYEINEKYNTYHGIGFGYSTTSNEGYAHSREFLRWVTGDLQCGGISVVSYGRIKVVGYRNQNNFKVITIV